VGALALGGCETVKVKRSSSAEHLEPKPADCDLDWLPRAPPGRTFHEIAELYTHVTTPAFATPDVVLGEKACELGADAVIVVRNFVINPLGHKIIAGKAIKYDQPPNAGSAGM
jgi:hypothetical protein